MNVRIQVIIEHESHPEETAIAEEVFSLHRKALQLETLGLQLDESKHLLRAIQACLVREQVAAFVAKARTCPTCGARQSTKDTKPLVMRTLFGAFDYRAPGCTSAPVSQPRNAVSARLPGFLRSGQRPS